MALVGLGLAGGAAVVAVRHALMTPQPLASGLPGEGRLDRQHGGDVYYAVAGPEDGLPVVLLHDFYPGASNYEFRAIYGRLAETYRVYAPDWLGFGMSERPPLVLTGEFYAMMLVGFLRDVVGRPAVVVARGRAANIAARAAADEPALFDRLALVGPDLEAGERLDPTAGQVAARLFQRVSLGLAPYAMMSLRPALRLAEGLRSAVGPGLVDEETVDHLYASAHQFGGQYGAMALLTGELDLPIQNVFPTLEPPALVVVGERDQDLPLSRLERLVALNPHADLEVILSAGATVYQDQPKLFVGALHRWLGRRIARQTARIEAWTVAEAAERTTERVAAPVMAERATPALAEAVAPAAVAQSPKLEAAPAAVVAIEDVPAEASETPSPTLAELMETPEEADAASKDVTAPVKIVPVLDTADGSDAPQVHAGEPRMQTRVAPRQERKTAPRTEPKPEAQAKAKVKAKPEAKAPRPTARPKGAAKARSEAKPSAEKAGSKAKLSTEKAGSRAKPKAQEAPATPSPRKRAGAAKTSSSGTAPRRRKQPGEG
ncbi:MAG TPA: alpha/beta fold hydrolase [Ktedonobacterales bacterium]|nr:alpha/beta fold hydrolase [Ktedonobacterales bacterium]